MGVEVYGDSTLVPRPLEQLHTRSVCFPPLLITESCGGDDPVANGCFVDGKWEIWGVARVPGIDGVGGVSEDVGIDVGWQGEGFFTSLGRQG